MGIANNNFRDSYGSIRFFGGTTLSNGSMPSMDSFGNKITGSNRNIFAGEAGIDPLSSKPAGTRPPYAYQMPQKAGGLASRNNTQITLSPTGFAVGGKPISGSTTITFTPTATGGLIVSGSGTATITFSPTGSILSVASGSGSASITFSSSALIGALAGLSASSTISLSPAGEITAIGYLSGTSTNETEFSADALARAVWDALAADFNNPGSMGELLGNASSAGDPWGTALPGAYADGTAGKIVGSKLLKLAQFLALTLK